MENIEQKQPLVDSILFKGIAALGILFCTWTGIAWLWSEAVALWVFRVASIAVPGSLIFLAVHRFRIDRRKAEIMLKSASNKVDWRVENLKDNAILIDCNTRRIHQISVNQGLIQADSGVDSAADEAERLPNLAEYLIEMDRVLILGGMGSGKSELLRWLADWRSMDGQTIIIDSHAAPGDWPEGCNVVGIGRDYQAIRIELELIMEEMQRRYQARSSGLARHFDPLTLVIDELTVLNAFVDASEQFKSLLCECRKVNIKLIFAGQSDRARSLGLLGNYDLKDGFESVVYLEKDKKKNLFWGKVYEGRSKEALRLDHPGRFRRSCRSHDSYKTAGSGFVRENRHMQDRQESQEKPRRIAYERDSEKCAQFDKLDIAYRGFHAGLSQRQVSRAIYGYDNGKTNTEVKNMWIEMGLID